MFHTLPERSVMPMASVITAGNCTPGAEPAATSSGLAVIDKVNVSPSKLSAHDMFVPQTMSATVCDRLPAQPGGPLLWEAGGPQSPSVTRMRAADAISIFSLNLRTIESGELRELWFDDARTTGVDVGTVESDGPKTVTGCWFEWATAPLSGSRVRIR